MFGNDDKVSKNQSSIFDHDVNSSKQTKKIVIDFHDRKTQLITGGIVLLLLIFGIWLHGRLTMPMTEKAVSPDRYASARVDKQDSRHNNNGSIAKEASGREIPDGFHQ